MGYAALVIGGILLLGVVIILADYYIRH